MTVQSRVYSRLHWDRTLNPLNIEVEVNNDGVAILRGAVPMLKAKDRALDLARETVGVTSVVDELAIRASSSTESISTPRGTTTTTTTKKTVVSPPRP